MLFLLLLAFAASRIAFGQAAQAELTGTVKDAAGANVSNVRVALTEIASNQTREIVTDAEGVFIFTNQKPGVYRIACTANGFSELVRENVTLTTSERIRLDETVTVAGVRTTVTVSSDAPLLRSETSSLG